MKKDPFAKITAVTVVKPTVESPITPAPIPPAPYQIHRHHRNASTVSQNDAILTTQPSTQSIANNIVSEQSYSSIINEPPINTSNPMNNGTTNYHTTRRHPQPIQQNIPPSGTSASNTSESINMDPSAANNPSATPNNNQWRHKLNNLKQSFQNVGTPRFHRRPKILRMYSYHKSIVYILFYWLIYFSNRKFKFDNINFTFTIWYNARGNKEIALSSYNRCNARRSPYDCRQRSTFGCH